MALIAGFSEGFHDAAICLLDDNRIVHASRSERYSKEKNDRRLHPEQLAMLRTTDTVAYYEKPWLKATRRIYSRQKLAWPRTKYDVAFAHQETHTAAGYYTAFDDCNILVVDAIGEWDTTPIWDNMRKVRGWRYPYSLGLLYSAITKRLSMSIRFPALTRPFRAMRRYLAWRRRAKRMNQEDGYLYD